MLEKSQKKIPLFVFQKNYKFCLGKKKKPLIPIRIMTLPVRH